ncbi:MAG: hypothetical protein OQK82_06665, partial [Candidatus Pacearchaeota archaeon]|nr:hypothetical protein [Candidatus Pacearchaeota archaeon]
NKKEEEKMKSYINKKTLVGVMFLSFMFQACSEQVSHAKKYWTEESQIQKNSSLDLDLSKLNHAFSKLAEDCPRK